VEPTKLLYRALNTRDHKERWLRKEFYSFHHDPPGEWWICWKGTKSINLEDYPLETLLGTFAESARSAFLELVQTQPDSRTWSYTQRKRVSELAGVCAFETPLGAYRYGTDGEGIPYAFFVEFQGRELCKTPEPGGVVAEMVEEVAGPMDSEAFRRRHHL
jgi:hypothetical protein